MKFGGACATGAALVLAACSALVPAPSRDGGIESLDTEPRPGEEVAMLREPGNPQPAGPVIEVARGTVDGEAFGITVFRTADGACIWMKREVSGGGGGCGASPGGGLREFGPFGMFSTAVGDGTFQISGLVVPEAATVRIEFLDGSHDTAALISLAAADVDASLFVAFLSGHPAVRSVVAMDADGTELGRFDLVPTGPAGPPVIAPTPKTP